MSKDIRIIFSLQSPKFHLVFKYFSLFPYFSTLHFSPYSSPTFLFPHSPPHTFPLTFLSAFLPLHFSPCIPPSPCIFSLAFLPPPSPLNSSYFPFSEARSHINLYFFCIDSSSLLLFWISSRKYSSIFLSCI